MLSSLHAVPLFCAAAAMLASLASGQDLRLRPIQTLLPFPEEEGLERAALAHDVWAASNVPHLPGYDEELEKLHADGLTSEEEQLSELMTKLVDHTGTRAWRERSVELLESETDRLILVTATEMRLDPETLERTHWTERVLCDERGHLIRAAYLDASTPAGHRLEVTEEDGAWDLSQVRGRTRRSLAKLGERPTARPEVLCLLVSEADRSFDSRALDWQAHRTEPFTYESGVDGDSVTWRAGDRWVRMDTSGEVVALSEPSPVGILREQEASALQLAESMVGGFPPPPFGDRISASISSRKGLIEVRAAGLQLRVPSSFGEPEISESGGFHVETEDEAVVIRLRVEVLSPATTVDEFMASGFPQIALYGVETKLLENKNVRLGRRDAIKKRYRITRSGDEYEKREYFQVVDGLGFELAIEFRKEDAGKGRATVRKLLSSWKFLGE